VPKETTSILTGFKLTPDRQPIYYISDKLTIV